MATLWRARWPISSQRSESPADFPLVLAFDDGSNLRVVATVTTAWPVASVSAATSAAPGVAMPDRPATLNQPGFLAALLFALLGGVILNLMPCVFPVLSLKVLALAQHSGNARERWTSALAYTAGVVIAFLALAGLLIAARAGGAGLGWGFQLQSPGDRCGARRVVHAHRPQPGRRLRIRVAAAVERGLAARA